MMRQPSLNHTAMLRLQQLADQQGISAEILLDKLLANADPPSVPLAGLPDALAWDVLSLLPDAVIIVSEQQRILQCNASAARMFGYADAEMTGQPLEKLLPDEMTHQHRQYMEEFARDAEPSRRMAEHGRVRGRRKDGTLFPADGTILKYRHAGQMVFVAIVRDVSEREALVDDLREREKLLGLLTEDTPDLICLHQPNGIYLYLSPAIHTIGGYEATELIGANPYTYIHPDDLLVIRESHHVAMSGIPTTRVTYRFRRKDGIYTWLETATTPVHDEQGGLSHLVTISRDMSENRRIQDELRTERDLLARIMETSPSGINVVDKDGTIVFANRRSEEILGTPKHHITARSYDAPTWKHTDYDGNPWRDEQQPFVQVMQTKEPVWEVRHAIEWSNGTKVYLSINGAPILDEQGEVSKVVFSIEDYTQRKLQQDEIEAALTREKKLNESKSAFISMVSHEFRTPISIIRLSTDILRMRGEKLTRDEILNRLDKIEFQVHRLNQLMDDVTFINRNDLVGQSVQHSPMDIGQFFSQLVEEIDSAYPDHRPVELVQELPGGVHWLDGGLMQQIFGNLLSNAMKYSRPSDRVLCRFGIDAAMLRVLVSDTGIGIPPNDQQNLFDLFYRASNVGAISGTGLGLPIVKRAVDALKGSISFESDVGSGTTFIVTIPLELK